MGALSAVTLKEKGRFLRNLLLPMAIIVEIALFAMIEPKIIVKGNIVNILTQMTTLTFLSLGITFVIAAEGIDLSLGSIMSVISVSIAMVLVSTESIMASVIAGLAIGLLYGLVNGYIIAYYNVQPFATTIGTMTIGAGGALLLCGGNPVRNLPEAFSFIGNGFFLNLPVQNWFIGASVVVCYILLHWTPFGASCFAAGGGRRCAELSGINVRRVKMATYIIAGFFAGAAAVVATSRVSSGQPVLGLSNVQMHAIAAAVIGGASMRGGKGSIIGSVFGAIFITVLQNGANLVRVSPYVQDLMIGMIILLSAGADALKANK